MKQVTLLCLMLALGSCKWINTKTGHLKLYNGKSYESIVAVHYMKDQYTSTTKSFLLKAGENLNLEVDFYDIEPNFYVYSRPSNNNIEFKEWLFDRNLFLKKVTDPSIAANEVQVNYSPEMDLRQFSTPKVQSGLIDSTNFFKVRIKERDTTPIITVNNLPINFQDTEVESLKFEKVVMNQKWRASKGFFCLRDYNPLFTDIYHSKAQEFGIDSVYAEYADNAARKFKKLQNEFNGIGTFVVRNAAPYKIAIVINYQFSRDSSHTQGWYHLEAGEETTFTREFRGIRPHLDIYAQSSGDESELIKELNGGSYDAPKRKYFQPSANQAKIFKAIHPTEKIEYKSLAVVEENENYETYPVAFIDNIGAEEQYPGYYTGDYTIYDLDFPSLADHYDSEEDIIEFNKKSSIKAKELNRSLENMMFSKKKFKNFSYDSPFMLGIQLEDFNGIYGLGVRVSNNFYTTDIFNNESPFKMGDIITSFAGQAVFGIHDLHALLYKHANNVSSGGIGKPIPFTLIRGNQEFSGKTMYRFNANYYGWPDDECFEAFFHGLFDALAIGFDDELVSAWYGSEEEAKAWKYLQTKVRLKQLYPNCSFVGTILGGVGSPGRLIFQGAVKKQLVRVGLSRSMSSIVSASFLEGAENVFWTIGNKPPLISEYDFSQHLKQNAKDGVAFGFAFASFDLIRRF
ncbi:hypothetical protein V1387_04855 [Allomuricauda taeanensis]|uniref:hypothetical protein n=1 Tax=Flagellimonas taeanensis TaxID=1005926 RepID=UPI002E7AE02D|nr:hypothetical protein [Allomuricauda taeanensis]MEE1962005.1 hypothetical protein [Allomuricauda taeanensis]